MLNLSSFSSIINPNIKISLFLRAFFIYFMTAVAKWNFSSDIKCVCGAAIRQLNRPKSGKGNLQSRCSCKHWKKGTYKCGCKRKSKHGKCIGNASNTDQQEETQKSSCCG